MVVGSVQAVVGAAIVLVAAALHTSIWPMLVGLFLVVSCLIAIVQNAMALALDPYPDIAGSASAVVGVLQFAIGAATLAARRRRRQRHGAADGDHDRGPVLVRARAVAHAAPLARAVRRPRPAAGVSDPAAFGVLEAASALRARRAVGRRVAGRLPGGDRRPQRRPADLRRRARRGQRLGAPVPRAGRRAGARGRRATRPRRRRDAAAVRRPARAQGPLRRRRAPAHRVEPRARGQRRRRRRDRVGAARRRGHGARRPHPHARVRRGWDDRPGRQPARARSQRRRLQRRLGRRAGRRDGPRRRWAPTRPAR